MSFPLSPQTHWFSALSLTNPFTCKVVQGFDIIFIDTKFKMSMLQLQYKGTRGSGPLRQDNTRRQESFPICISKVHPPNDNNVFILNPPLSATMINNLYLSETCSEGSIINVRGRDLLKYSTKIKLLCYLTAVELHESLFFSHLLSEDVSMFIRVFGKNLLSIVDYLALHLIHS